MFKRNLIGLVLFSGISAIALPSLGAVNGWYTGASAAKSASANNYDQDLGTSTNRVCFLSGIGGQLNGGGEWAYIYLNLSDNHWHLRVTGLSAGIRADARCIAVDGPADYTAEYSWSQGQRATPMVPASGNQCFLTGVGGHYAGGGESAYLTIVNSYWYLQGSSMQQGVGANARCVRTTSGERRYTFGPHTAAKSMDYAEFFTNDQTTEGNAIFGDGATLMPWPVCFLTGIGGAFQTWTGTNTDLVYTQPTDVNSSIYSPPFNWYGYTWGTNWKWMGVGCL